MPRAGLSSLDVVAAAAELADEAGYTELAMGLVAQRLGIRTPSLYKHVDDLADLRHRVAPGAPVFPLSVTLTVLLLETLPSAHSRGDS